MSVRKRVVFQAAEEDQMLMRPSEFCQDKFC
jgi:hypothetical protein